MVNTQLDFPLLKTHLDSRNVIQIHVREIKCLSEESVRNVIDDLLAQVVQLLVIETEIRAIQNMVVVPTVVEANELHTQKLLDFACATG